jgi:hypothetical protein
MRFDLAQVLIPTMKQTKGRGLDQFYIEISRKQAGYCQQYKDNSLLEDARSRSCARWFHRSLALRD